MRTVRSESLESRFWKKVVVKGDNDCWPWVAATIQGYGCIGVGNGKTALASRVSWSMKHGPIPSGKYVLHSCDNPRCVNPAHLYVGTAADNSKDMVLRGRGVSGKSILTDLDVAEIHRMHFLGKTNTEIAEKFGVQQPAICKVLAGKTPRYMRLKIQHEISLQCST